MPDPQETRDLGFRAATEVVERFIRLMGDDPRPPGQPASEDRSAFRQLRADLARAVDANLDLIRRAFDLYAGAVDRLLGGETEADGRHFQMPAVLPGHQASSTLWIHNTTASAASGLRLHGSDLVSHNRGTIPADAWRFEPTEIDIAPPGSSLPVAVDLAVSGDTPPGIYRGHVFVTNLPGEYMTIEIEVVQPINQEQRWRDQRRAS
ncbi:MAG TPA: hypothetical protein VJ935_08455 [Acidimicrobiia bacterium]|nr:hypothetical protein [Acidimicrobiia bacterium]